MDMLSNIGTTSIFDQMYLKQGKLYRMIDPGIDLYVVSPNGKINHSYWLRPTKTRHGEILLLHLKTIETDTTRVSCLFLVGDKIMKSESFSPFLYRKFFIEAGS